MTHPRNTFEAIRDFPAKGANPQGHATKIAVENDGATITTPRRAKVLDYFSFTIANAAGTMFVLADSGFPTSAPNGAKSFKGILQTAQIRVRGDETIPSTTEGEPLSPGDTIYLSADEFYIMQFIRTTSTSGVVKGHFYDAELSGGA